MDSLKYKMQLLEQVEDIFENLRKSHITAENAQNQLKNIFFRINEQEARLIMKKMDCYQYEENLQQTVYAVCPIVYNLIKDCD